MGGISGQPLLFFYVSHPPRGVSQAPASSSFPPTPCPESAGPCETRVMDAARA